MKITMSDILCIKSDIYASAYTTNSSEQDWEGTEDRIAKVEFLWKLYQEVCGMTPNPPEDY